MCKAYKFMYEKIIKLWVEKYVNLNEKFYIEKCS